MTPANTFRYFGEMATYLFRRYWSSTLVAVKYFRSATMECRYKDDCVSRLELILVFAFQLPVRIVNEDKDTWSSALVSVYDTIDLCK